MVSTELDHLLSECARGNEASFSSLYAASKPRLQALAYRILRDHHRAEDVLQQAMLSIWHTAPDFDPALGSAEAWLATLVRNRAIDEYRRERRRRAAVTAERNAAEANPVQFAAVTMQDPLSESAARKINDCFNAMGILPARSIRLAYIDGMTCREISLRLDVPVGTVKSWLRRGMKQLRKSVAR